KQLLRNFLYGLLPEPLHTNFKNEFNISRADVIESIYNKPQPNLYIASFMHFLISNQADPYVHSMLLQGIKTFFETHVNSFAEVETMPVHFCGSVAAALESE